MGAERLAIADLGRIFRGDSVSGLSEWQLLERYRERRDDLAFEALVTRHGPMVLGVCRRMLGASPEVEDAFQATFLVLIRRARDLGPRDALGPWLHGVARKVASRARTRVARSRRIQGTPLDVSIPVQRHSSLDPDVVEILDQELGRLPGKYRSPLVLCYLEGRTHEEAARDLQWPLGTVKGRLARARELLRSRLARRGYTPSAGVTGLLSSPELRIVLDPPLVGRTVGASAQVGSQSIKSLAEGVIASMFINKMKWAALAVVASGFAFTTAVVLGRQDPRPEPVEIPTKGFLSQFDKTTAKVYQKEKVGALPDSVPKRGTMDGMMKKRHAVEPVEGADSRTGDPRSRQILAKLEEPIAMSFANETPLDDVLKYIKQATTTPTFSGIPIYVDPAGLQAAERSLNSTVLIDLEGVPLRRTLQLILAQLNLAYFVQDGMLVITAKERASERLPPVMPKPAPIYELYEEAERGELTSQELKELIEVIRLRHQVRLMHETYNSRTGAGGGFGGGREFPGEEGARETKELLKDVRELIQLLKAEKLEKKPAETKADRVRSPAKPD